jgi:glutaminyl-peptide cyclotransferase
VISRLLVLAAAIALFSVCHAAEPVEPKRYGYKIVNVFPHDETAFTQGLTFHEGFLFETTGQYGESRLRKAALDTGETIKNAPLPASVFGEGSTLWGENIIVLTWRNKTGIVFDRETFTPQKTFAYEGEGWGLTHDGTRLIMSDGTPDLRFLNPETLKETGRLTVTLRGAPLNNLNELEWVEGEIFANVWQSNAIVRIDPESGAVTGVIDMRGILEEAGAISARADVLNGVAYDPATKRLFVTGKYWPKLFEVEIIDPTQTPLSND